MPPRQFPGKFLVAFSFAGEQRELVRPIAEAVERKLGSSTVFFDEWFEYYIAGADADLKLQRIYCQNCELVVVCISERYGGKPWTQAEHEAIRERQMKARNSKDQRERDRILPIRVGDGDVEGILFNTIVPDIRMKAVEETVELIIGRLHFFVPDPGAVASPDADWRLPEQLTGLQWPMADQSEVRDAFAALLTRGTEWRFLPICGPSETGKSYITKQMLANALQMSNLACGRFDFKGGIDIDAEFRAFVQELDIPLPPANALLNERLAQVLDALSDSKRPTLLIFDTYDAAAKPQQDWIEKELLVRLVRAPWLRVVIAGQRIPERVGAIWNSISHHILDLKPPPPAEWFDYGKQFQPELKLEEVEIVCRLAKYKPTLLAQMLGPAS